MPTAVSDGVSIEWEEVGSGEPLLLIMGHRFSRRMWYPALPALSSRYRVLMFDNRGVGGSGSPRGPYTVAQMAADAVSVLDAAGVDSAHVYGVSMGGIVAQELALAAPDRVRSLILGCTAALSPEKKRPPRVSYAQYWLPPSLTARMARALLYGPRTSPDVIASDLQMLAGERWPARGLVGQARAMAAYNNGDRVGAITAPTLVLHGTHDRVIPIAWGEELARLIPTARFVPLEDAGHNYLADSADRANDEVLGFLTSLSAQPKT